MGHPLANDMVRTILIVVGFTTGPEVFKKSSQLVGESL